MQAGPPSLVVWQFVTPGGCAVERFSDGTADGATYDAARVCLGHVDDPHDGLLAEIEGNRDPVPWVSARVKADAVAQVGAMIRIADADRARMLAHIKKTPHFAD